MRKIGASPSSPSALKVMEYLINELSTSIRPFIIILVLVLAIPIPTTALSISAGTIFAPSDSKTKYVLHDISMHSISINNWTIYLDDNIFHVESATTETTVIINAWGPPSVDLEVIGWSPVHFDLGGYIPLKHYRFNAYGVYHSVQANINGEIETNVICVSPVLITIRGEWDINLDGATNYLELSSVISKYGTTGESGWISSDINDDGSINYKEISNVISHYGSIN